MTAVFLHSADCFMNDLIQTSARLMRSSKAWTCCAGSITIA
jgi:hypothetical protein